MTTARVTLEATALLDVIDEPASLFTIAGEYVHVNRAAEERLARPLREVIGRHYLEIFPDLADHPFHNAFQRVATGSSPLERLEAHYAPLDSWSDQRIYATRGYVVVFWADITARKRAERELELLRLQASETERQFREMIEGLPQLAWWARPDGFIEYYNPRWYEYTGTQASDMEGWGWQSVHDPLMLPAVMHRWQASIATGATFEMEFPLRRHDGAFRWFLTRVTPTRNAAGEITRWIGINTDIDDHRQSLRLLAETLESMGDAFFLLDREFRFVMVNRNQERVSATRRGDTLGRSFWEVFPATAAPGSKYWTEYHRVMATREEAHFEEYYPPLDLWTEVDAFPAHDGGIAVFFRDVSERKRAEAHRAELLERERQARAEAETANRSKDEFLAMLGHELRNPLAPIMTALQLMRLRGESTAERERSVIERQTRHLVRLVDDLLDMSRITRGKVELARESLDLGAVMAAAIEMASPLIEERQHHLSVRVEAGLRVVGDAHRLSQVFANLLTNAARYTPEGGRILVTADRADGWIVASVTDTGVGISADLLPRVFELFVQGSQGLDRAQGGLGLGLTIVQRLVELHHGRVMATSAGVGHGSTFSVRLPEPSSLPVREPSPVPAGPAAGPAPAAVQRVFIVDDNEDAAEMLSEVLKARGCETRTAHDGPSALDVLADFRPDVAILDIGLPGMDGYELAGRIHALPGLADLLLVAVTGYGQESDRQRSAQAGFHAHLTKPVALDHLYALLDSARR